MKKSMSWQKIPAKYRTAFLLSTTALLFILLFLGIWSPAQKIRQNLARATTLRHNIRQLRQELAVLHASDSTSTAALDSLRAGRSAFTSAKAAWAALTKPIEENLALNAINLEQHDLAGRPAHRFRMNLSGNYPALMDYLRTLETAPHRIVVQRIDIANGVPAAPDEGLHRLRCELSGLLF